MKTASKKTRLPKSVRKHIRRQKALLRSTLEAPEAKTAVDQLVRRLHQSPGTSQG